MRYLGHTFDLFSKKVKNQYDIYIRVFIGSTAAGIFAKFEHQLCGGPAQGYQVSHLSLSQVSQELHLLLV